MDGSSRASAVLDVKRNDGEQQEAYAHAKAHAVHGLVAHEHLAVDVGSHFGDEGNVSVHAETRNLREKITQS